jgi:hypothetical protein
MRRARHAGWVRFFTFLLVAALSDAQPSAVSIRIVEGDGAINSIKLRRGHDPAVQVVDAAGEPIQGAAVTFLLPASGPGASFGDSGLSLTITTDPRGMAAARGLRPNRVEGQFRIRVTTSWQGVAANATVLQTNAEPVGKMSSSKWAVIAIAVGGAVAGGAAAAMHGGKSSTSAAAAANSPVSTGVSTIVPGAPSFGPPK